MTRSTSSVVFCKSHYIIMLTSFFMLPNQNAPSLSPYCPPTYVYVLQLYSVYTPIMWQPRSQAVSRFIDHVHDFLRVVHRSHTWSRKRSGRRTENEANCVVSLSTFQPSRMTIADSACILSANTQYVVCSYIVDITTNLFDQIQAVCRPPLHHDRKIDRHTLCPTGCCHRSQFGPQVHWFLHEA